MTGARSAAGLPPILPAPRRAKRERGAWRVRPGLPIVLGSEAGDADFEAARALALGLEQRCGVRLPVETHARTEGLGARIELRRRGEEGEAYRVEVGAGGVAALGLGRAGLRYAVETLLQLVDRRGRVPLCRIEDEPLFERRGILLDVSRGKVPTEATLRELVDLCVRLKLNVLVLYVEHTFRFRRHPQIGADVDPLDAELLRALDAYAAARHVELIPCLQSLGHMEHVLRLPRYAHLAETEQRWTLAPAERETYVLLRELYGEFLPNFRSRSFHANCDEPYDLGRGRSAERAEALGPGGLFVEHVRRVRRLAAAFGKRTLIWGDVVHAHPRRIRELPRDLVLLDWGYEANHDTEACAAFRRHGLEFWVCPGTSTWNALFPRTENAERNIERWAAAGRRHGAQGFLLTDWGDFGHYNLQGNSWLAYAYAAQQAWSGGVRAAEFDRAFGTRLFEDATGATARAYRDLGRWHDVGFSVQNGSGVQFLYFDDLRRAFFVRGAERRALRRTLAGLERARTRLGRARSRFRADPLTFEELRLAADASILAVRKGLIGLDYVAWREGKRPLDGTQRLRLARALEQLAAEQQRLGRTLRRLWLRRSRLSEFAITRRRLNGSIRGLQHAARELRRGRSGPAFPPHPGFTPRAVLAELRRSAGPGRASDQDAGEASSSPPPRRRSTRRAIPAR